MRELDTKIIKEELTKLLISINYKLQDPEVKVLKESYEKENSTTGKKILGTIIENLDAASEIGVPICQDTGMVVLFVELGQNLHIKGQNLMETINEAVNDAYVGAYLRASVVKDPLFNRVNTKNNTPAIVHMTMVDGEKLKIIATTKGFGSENMAQIKMFNPTATKEDICDFVVKAVTDAGSNPCPPIHVGVGIGGTFDYAAVLAKKALTRGIDIPNSDSNYAELEKTILNKINETGIGPQGFGGKTTALGVNIEYYPTHIAGLPVAVNINCHVMRHGMIEL